MRAFVASRSARRAGRVGSSWFSTGVLDGSLPGSPDGSTDGSPIAPAVQPSRLPSVDPGVSSASRVPVPAGAVPGTRGDGPRYPDHGYTGRESGGGYDNGNLNADLPGSMDVDYVRVWQG